MARFMVCPSCEGRGASSAYLGAFTSDDIAEMDEDFMIDYFSGQFDRPCEECQGRNVVPVCKIDGCEEQAAVLHGFFSGRQQSDRCFDHDADMRESAECEAQGAAERAYGC